MRAILAQVSDRCDQASEKNSHSSSRSKTNTAKITRNPFGSHLLNRRCGMVRASRSGLPCRRTRTNAHSSLAVVGLRARAPLSILSQSGAYLLAGNYVKEERLIRIPKLPSFSSEMKTMPASSNTFLMRSSVAGRRVSPFSNRTRVC